MATKAEKRALRLQQRNSEVKKQRTAAARRRRNKKIINYGIIGLIALIILVAGYQVFLDKTAPGLYDDFAICLTNAGVAMYGTDWCPHCQAQKQLFGNSFKHVIYINCDANPVACDNQEVTGYPTWIFADESRLSGEQTLETLAEKTGCSIE